MGRPKQSTLKKLFTLAGNRCAFPSCDRTLVDAESGSLVARVCHIKGRRPGSARHDEDQSEKDRHSLENLVVMCPGHSDIIDDKANLKWYTVEWLHEVKEQHESQQQEKVDGKLAEKLAIEAIDMLEMSALSVNQTGGQTANVIVNIGDAKEKTQDFEKQLRSRNLFDRHDEQFALTQYSRELGTWDQNGQLQAPLATALLFAITSDPIISSNQNNQLLTWMNPNNRRYPPFENRIFVPTWNPDAVLGGLVWHDGIDNVHLLGHQSAKKYTKYLAIERKGFVEYGFNPCHPWDQNEQAIYYAKVIVNTFVFLRFLKDLFVKFTVSPACIGIAIWSPNSLALKGIIESLRRRSFAPAPSASKHFLLRFELQPDWNVEEVARETALGILGNWSYPVSTYMGVPEFENDKYVGTFFESNFPGSEFA